MFKIFSFILTLLCTTSLYGQEVRLKKNVNRDAKKLEFKQYINESGDSLILECPKKPIKQVDVMNKDYFEIKDINSHKAKIDLNQLPTGNYVVQAGIGRRWIVMYLSKPKTESEEAYHDKKERLRKNTTKTIQKTTPNTFDVYDFYWVVYESNNNFGSNKTMSLKYKDEIHELISTIELELKSEVGKHNRLVVYEIYNKRKFMRKQMRNRKYYKSRKSRFFNVNPIYNSDHEKLDN